MPIHTENGHILKMSARPDGVSFIVECDEDVCETMELALTKEQFLLVMYEGLKVVNGEGSL